MGSDEQLWSALDQPAGRGPAALGVARSVVACVAISVSLLAAAFAVADTAPGPGAVGAQGPLMSLPASTLILIPAPVPHDRNTAGGGLCYDPALWP